MSDALLRVRIMSEPLALEHVIGVAMSLGAQGVEVCDSDTHDLPADTIWVHAWHGAREDPAALMSAYRQGLGTLGEVHVDFEDTDWRAALVSEPARALGDRFVISESGESMDHRIPLLIASGLGFGDGVHPTTQCCAFLIERVMTASRCPRVIDVGTGTGVLGIMAAKLGAASVIGTDIDGVAREAAQRNVSANEVDLVMRVASQIPDGHQADLLIANLYLGVLPAMIPAIASTTHSDGRCIISGFTIHGETLITQLMGDHGFEVCERVSRSEWVALWLQRSKE